MDGFFLGAVGGKERRGGACVYVCMYACVRALYERGVFFFFFFFF